ncbi:MAG TPA: ATP-dependent RecD-like DNA helicase [Candidatus Faecimonas intestinavium]|nr:ATP-dependent RecD-like DNA helicase [Candidatus Faecimonas intestinavium]
MDIYIKGHYQRSIYQNSNGYHIGLFKVRETNSPELTPFLDKTITFTGYFHELNDMDTYLFFGQMVEHPKYGLQFSVTSYERCKPEEKDAIVEFLTSGLFKGIGEKKAKAIVDVLGKDTLQIILENPDNLILIPGITKTNIDTLHNKLKEYESSYETVLYLSNLGFSTKDSMLIYNYYKDRVKEVIEEDIYQLEYSIYELNFKKIDRIALKNGMAKDSFVRVRAAILYIMEEVSNTYGHSYFYCDEIFQYLPRVLLISISDEVYKKAMESLIVDLMVVNKEDRYYLKDMWEAETLIVKRFRLLAHKEDEDFKNLEDKLTEMESVFGISYNEEQRRAILDSIRKNFLIITGGPGTGKTTIMKGIIELYKEVHKLSYEKLAERVQLLAPTGRAAKRMSDATLMPASTIHRFLKWQKETNKFQVNEYHKSKAEVVILDESSMVDTLLMASLLRGISANCKVIMVGDSYQLPSVGPGQVLHDLISSSKLPVVELKELYRQGKDSNILTLAYDVRKGEVVDDVFNKEEDLTFIECSDDDVISNLMDVSSTFKDLSYKNFQILAPMYKTKCGIDMINQKLQVIFNPKDKSKKELVVGDVIFREGDKVIELTNMPDENIYNGDIGIISQIVTQPAKKITIDFDGNEVTFTAANFNKFRLAYAISIHKAQGSEFDVVVMPIVQGYRKMLYRKLVYTGITRSKKMLYLIGDKNALRQAVNNTSSDIRRTTIKDFLENGIK